MNGPVLTIDVGTTLIKGALFSPAGEVLVKKRRPLPQAPLFSGDRHEINPRDWMQGIRYLWAEMAPEAREAPAALCLSGNGPTLVCTDREGSPLGPAFSWLDRRSIEETRLIQEKTGSYIDPTFYLPKLLWMRKHQPEMFKQIYHVFGCPEFLLFRATGRAVQLLTGPALARFVWNDSLIEALELPEKIFPPREKPGLLMGPLLPSAAREWNLPEDIPVIGGGPDFALTLLGTATVRPGQVCVRSGTSDGINLCGTEILPDPRLMSFEHPIPGLVNSSGTISNSGKALDWFKGSFFPSGSSYDHVLDTALHITPGSNGLLFLPYLSGERAPLWDPLARGAFIGLSSSHDLTQMLRALLESTGFAIRDVIEIMKEQGGGVSDLRITGNPTRSPLWNQIKADITGCRILVPQIREAELTGGAVLSCHALGVFPDLAEAAEALVHFERIYEPDFKDRRVYEELFQLYRRSYTQLKEVNHRLARLQTGG